MRNIIFFILLLGGAFFSKQLGAQARPSYCEPIADGMLKALAAPYSRQIAPDGSIYCEGLIRAPIALQSLSVISIKQRQSKDVSFKAQSTASLTWCGDPKDEWHVSLRAFAQPLFALDAVHATAFVWRSEEISRFQPYWENLAALASHRVILKSVDSLVYVPLRSGRGYSSEYSFVLRAPPDIRLTKVLLQPVDRPESAILMDVAFASGPSKGIWTTTVPFSGMRSGVYRVTFEEATDSDGATADPIYVLHKSCANQ